MVYHNKQEDLKSMIALATQIDNRLYEQKLQKKEVVIPNTKKSQQQKY
jgi:hypothetical protein